MPIVEKEDSIAISSAAADSAEVLNVHWSQDWTQHNAAYCRIDVPNKDQRKRAKSHSRVYADC